MVQLARFFYIYIYIYIYMCRRSVRVAGYRIVSAFLFRRLRVEKYRTATLHSLSRSPTMLKHSSSIIIGRVGRTEDAAVRRHVVAVLRLLLCVIPVLFQKVLLALKIQIEPRKRPVGRSRKAPPAVMASVMAEETTQIIILDEMTCV